MKFSVAILLFVLLNPAFSLYAKDLVFALVPKNTASSFFQQIQVGCIAAAKAVDAQCLFRGPEYTDVRLQDMVINELIEANVDGIAVSVTKSDFLARNSIQKAIKAGIPIVTFDSDFDFITLQKYPKIRHAYVGSNNFALGQALGRELKKLRPQGGNLIIQTGHPDSPNLNQRIMGFRSVFKHAELSELISTPLANDSGWTEVRTPYPSYGEISRANEQMKAALENKMFQLDAFVGVSGLPQFGHSTYNLYTATSYLKASDNKDTLIVMADTEAIQLSLLKQGLSHANVGQSQYQMGEKAILLLHAIVNNKPYEKINFTPLTLCNQQNYDVCTKVEKKGEKKAH